MGGDGGGRGRRRRCASCSSPSGTATLVQAAQLHPPPPASPRSCTPRTASQVQAARAHDVCALKHRGAAAENNFPWAQVRWAEPASGRRGCPCVRACVCVRATPARPPRSRPPPAAVRLRGAAAVVRVPGRAGGRTPRVSWALGPTCPGADMPPSEPCWAANTLDATAAAAFLRCPSLPAPTQPPPPHPTHPTPPFPPPTWPPRSFSKSLTSSRQQAGRAAGSGRRARAPPRAASAKRKAASAAVRGARGHAPPDGGADSEATVSDSEAALPLAAAVPTFDVRHSARRRLPTARPSSSATVASGRALVQPEGGGGSSGLTEPGCAECVVPSAYAVAVRTAAIEPFHAAPLQSLLLVPYVAPLPAPAPELLLLAPLPSAVFRAAAAAAAGGATPSPTAAAAAAALACSLPSPTAAAAATTLAQFLPVTPRAPPLARASSPLPFPPPCSPPCSPPSPPAGQTATGAECSGAAPASAAVRGVPPLPKLCVITSPPLWPAAPTPTAAWCAAAAAPAAPAPAPPPGPAARPPVAILGLSPIASPASTGTQMEPPVPPVITLDAPLPAIRTDVSPPSPMAAAALLDRLEGHPILTPRTAARATMDLVGIEHALRALAAGGGLEGAGGGVGPEGSNRRACGDGSGGGPSVATP